MLRSAMGLLLLGVSGVAPSGAPLVTGLEVEVDPGVAGAVRTLQLELQIGRPFSRDLVLDLVRRIQELGPVARVRTGTEPHGGGTRILCRIEANPPIASIEVIGNQLVPAREILARFRSRPGQILDYRRLYEDVASISRTYESRGLLYADVPRREDVKVDGGQVVIQVSEYRMGSVRTKGLPSGLRRLVSREFDLRPGDPVMRTKLLAGLQNVYQLPFVEDVTFTPRFDASRLRVDMELEIALKPTSPQGRVVAAQSPAPEGRRRWPEPTLRDARSE